ncbi:hypothetical protein LCGC14_2930780, partial [marine sediment metagenome]
MDEQHPDPRDFYKARYQGVEDLPGVGPAIATKLAAAGWKTVQSLATATERELASIGVGEETSKKIITAARKSLEIKFIKGDELAKLRADMTQMTTGCRALDFLLGGGLDTKSITEFSGEFGSGKSQMSQQLAVAVQLPLEKGGLDAACLYIDTEGVFRPARVNQMAVNLGLDPTE